LLFVQLLKVTAVEIMASTEVVMMADIFFFILCYVFVGEEICKANVDPRGNPFAYAKKRVSCFGFGSEKKAECQGKTR
jgi:hypothetical protein